VRTNRWLWRSCVLVPSRLCHPRDEDDFTTCLRKSYRKGPRADFMVMQCKHNFPNPGLIRDSSRTNTLHERKASMAKFRDEFSAKRTVLSAQVLIVRCECQQMCLLTICIEDAPTIPPKSTIRVLRMENVKRRSVRQSHEPHKQSKTDRQGVRTQQITA
jgi:hypothetical protein